MIPKLHSARILKDLGRLASIAYHTADGPDIMVNLSEEIVNRLLVRHIALECLRQNKLPKFKRRADTDHTADIVLLGY